jgi:hypothetical protein
MSSLSPQGVRLNVDPVSLPGVMGVAVNLVVRHALLHLPSLPLGGALAHTARCWPLRHPSHPANVGLACRPVGAWRRHLVQQLDSAGAPGTGTQLVRVNDGIVTTMEDIHRFSSPPAHAQVQVEATDISIQPQAIQLADGSIDVNTESAGDRPGIAIDEIHNGNTRDCLNVTLDGARHPVAALIALIDEVDG